MSPQKSHIWIEDSKSDGSIATLSAVTECASRGRTTLWFKLPNELASQSQCADAFTVGNIFLLMADGADCIVHGSVSPTLLSNLEEFQSAWACWRPEKYKRIDLSATTEREEQKAQQSDLSVAAFTGGVDSCFTMFRHASAKETFSSLRKIHSGLLVHGFDIPLLQDDAFERAANCVRNSLSSLDVGLITMATNLKEINIEWDDTHIAGIASCMHLLKDRFCEGLIGSSHTYDQLKMPWGSNPITDRFLSSGNFKIVHDGAGFKRWQKVKEIAKWTEGFENLRVCYSAERSDENCGKCLKCTFLIFLLRNMRIDIPSSFPVLRDEEICTLGETISGDIAGYKKLVQSAKTNGIKENWVELLSRQIEICERRKPRRGVKPRELS